MFSSTRLLKSVNILWFDLPTFNNDNFVGDRFIPENNPD
jgi:hypothetical protein